MANISPSMIESMYLELRHNGYTDEQVLALSTGLIEMARTDRAAVHGDGLAPGTFQRGLDELEALCSAGLPHQA